jgi:hypothetical protein
MMARSLHRIVALHRYVAGVTVNGETAMKKLIVLAIAAIAVIVTASAFNRTSLTRYSSAIAGNHHS